MNNTPKLIVETYMKLVPLDFGKMGLVTAYMYGYAHEVDRMLAFHWESIIAKRIKYGYLKNTRKGR